MTDPQFTDDILDCFRAERRAIPARWLYDFQGSKLFDTITNLPEYYPTRTETALLTSMLPEAASMIGDGRNIVEFGAGSVTKTPLLLNATNPAAFIPIDISGDFLRSSAEKLQNQFPDLPIYPVEANFMHNVDIPAVLSHNADLADNETLGFFPGSTIGNMVPSMAVDLLRSMRATLGDGGMLMIGFDRIKDLSVLIRAYDDNQGVTAAFNLNLLTRINRELQGNIPVDKFQHVARWNDVHQRIEMHLQSQQDIHFTIAGEDFAMREGETIHTENSHKYHIAEAQTLLRAAGWTPIQNWSDDDDYFSILLAEAQPIQSAP